MVIKWHLSCALSSPSDVSLKDWDVREQEGLREVEQILHRADDILEVRNTVVE